MMITLSHGTQLIEIRISDTGQAILPMLETCTVVTGAAPGRSTGAGRLPIKPALVAVGLAGAAFLGGNFWSHSGDLTASAGSSPTAIAERQDAVGAMTVRTAQPEAAQPTVPGNPAPLPNSAFGLD